MTKWDLKDCVCDCITQLVILLKNAPSLFILARHNRNKVLTGTIWNVTDLIGMSKMTNSINVVFLISNVKLADLAIFLSNCIEVLNSYNAFNWSMPLIN